MTDENREAAASSLRARAKAFAQRVAPLYQVLGYKWREHYDDGHVPDVSEIEAALHDLIDHIAAAGEQISSGGLTVGIDEFDGLIWTKLKFDVIDSTYFATNPR